MGITVTAAISSLASAGKSTPNCSGAADAAAPGGFSALLSDQLSSLATVLGETLGTSGLKENPNGKADKSEISEEDTASNAAEQILPFFSLPASLVSQAAKPATAKVEASEAGIDPEGKGRDSALPASFLAQDGNGKADAKGLPTAANAASGEIGTALGNSEAKAANIAGEQSEMPLPVAATPIEAGKGHFQEKLEAATAKQEVSVPLHDRNWGPAFNEKIVWVAKNELQSAQININPPQLGPVQISLQINGDQASAVFASPHAEVRQAIQDSLPQLKEMLSASGINLGQTDIGSNMAQQQREMPFQSANGQQRSTDETAILPGVENRAEQAVSAPIRRGKGMVDLFA